MLACSPSVIHPHHGILGDWVFTLCVCDPVPGFHSRAMATPRLHQLSAFLIGAVCDYVNPVLKN